MSTCIKSFFQKEVIGPGGIVTWEDIHSNFEDPQHYNLFAWLANIRNYNNLIPIVEEVRGCPPDLEDRFRDDWYMDDRPCHWLLGSEILDAVDRITPLRERGVIGNWVKWDGKTEPDTYSRYIDSDIRENYPMSHDVVKRDSGYTANVTEARWNYKRRDYKQSPLETVVGKGFMSFKPIHRRPSVVRHQEKLAKYAKRAGTYRYVAEWTVTPLQRREEFSFFIKEIVALTKEHGNIRMVMGFA